MSNIKMIREKFGITQQQLAQYLDVSHSAVALAETGKRLLPTAALIKLNTLQTPAKKLLLQADIASTQIEARAGAHKTLLTRAVKNIETQIVRQQKKLEILTTQQQQTVHTLNFVEHVKALKTTTPISKKDFAWFALLESAALQKLNKTHPLLLAKQQCEIAGMMQQLKALKKLTV
ncbi:MAG: helix-turn-helix domain-containing protein [Ferruginibacter sp.]